MDKYPHYVAIATGIQKKQLLDSEECYIVDSTVALLKNHGCETSLETVKMSC